MFRIVKFVQIHKDEATADFYYTESGFWSSKEDQAKLFTTETVVDQLVEAFNAKADKHFCSSHDEEYRITTYYKEEI